MINNLSFHSPQPSKSGRSYLQERPLKIRITRLLLVAALALSTSAPNAQTADASPQPNSATLIEDQQIGDWIVRCEQPAEQEPICVMTQQVNRPQSEEPLLQANFARNNELTLMTLQLPLGVYLPNGVIIQVDDFKPRKFDIHFCTQQGCYVNLTIDPEFVTLLRKKIGAKITVFRTDQNYIQAPMSLTGFFDAYKLL